MPPERFGCAGGLNDTARQTGTALGAACYGAIAGSPAQAGRFVAHLHVLAPAGLAVWLAAVAVGGSDGGPESQRRTNPKLSSQRPEAI